MAKTQELTPLMKQYYEIKATHVDALVLFQVGDFYELFYEDAQQAAAYLGIALTARGKNNGEPIPLCGVPIHSLDHYLCRLVKGGFKVAICDQLEEPRPGAIVKRGVTQVLTPGTLTDSKLLEARSASYLLSFYPLGDEWGLVFSELLTAQIFITTISAQSSKQLESELIRFFPDEIIIPAKNKEFQSYFKKLGYYTTLVHDDTDRLPEMLQWVEAKFDATTYNKVAHSDAFSLALYYFYAYMSKNQRASLDHYTSLLFYKPDDFLILDAATQRNLELLKNAHDGSSKNTLFEVLDCAKTAMGSRMIKKWLQRPLVNKDAIIQRQDAIQHFSHTISLAHAIEQLLLSIGDMERIIGRIALDRASVVDYRALSKILLVIPQLKSHIATASIPLLQLIFNHLGAFDRLAELLSNALCDNSESEWVIKKGFNVEFDQMRDLVDHGNNRISALEQKEQQETGISSLKIRYNAIQGYYIEVTNANLKSVPDHYRRLQTLVGRERFITKELQEVHYAIERARKDSIAYEQNLFNDIKKHVAAHIASLRKAAHALAHIDALLALSRLAYDKSYVRPSFNDDRNILIINGRHPVVEQTLESHFIPNNTTLTDEQSLWIITGPNMGGKSTYLRQVAQLCIMAHIGSFVPAESANLFLLDRIFTRLGAADNVAEGKSTFLVEMEETATICTQATERSLVILDEVGRGTSTFDGLAIAQSVVEYIFNVIRSRCLFATHYHELTALQSTMPGIAIYYAASKKTPTGIVFLYKIVQGIADGSFGIEVAKLADLPSSVIVRAATLVTSFAEGTSAIGILGENSQDEKRGNHSQLMQENRVLLEKIARIYPFIEKIQSIDFDSLSPKKAFDLLWELKDL